MPAQPAGEKVTQSRCGHERQRRSRFRSSSHFRETVWALAWIRRQKRWHLYRSRSRSPAWGSRPRIGSRADRIDAPVAHAAATNDFSRDWTGPLNQPPTKRPRERRTSWGWARSGHPLQTPNSGGRIGDRATHRASRPVLMLWHEKPRPDRPGGRFWSLAGVKIRWRGASTDGLRWRHTKRRRPDRR
jgi:hypothetical protein